jgi:hypothetical protein
MQTDSLSAKRITPVQKHFLKIGQVNLADFVFSAGFQGG